MVNLNFESRDALDQTVGERCIALAEQSETIRNSALFHWRPRPTRPKQSTGDYGLSLQPVRKIHTSATRQATMNSAVKARLSATLTSPRP